MKAKLINEVQNFKRGQNPYDKLNLGKYDDDYDFDDPKHLDRIELQESLYNIDEAQTIRERDVDDYISIEYKKGAIFIFDEDRMRPLWKDPDNGDIINDEWMRDLFDENLFKKLRQ